MIQTIARQYGVYYTDDEKSNWLKRNPVTKLPTPQNTASSSKTHCNHQIINSFPRILRNEHCISGRKLYLIACYLYCHISLHHFSNYNPLPTARYKGEF
ncbi:hypothetical protein GBAR_LOCUS11251 [Geodia barretti]|uniref:Uncharacterized protein n=1 Tax=Geodia barretti TaxID=519541 RepID=A0AA35RVJ9_GEOBA|nr:hypothetical protein GBAR_LOCUS11251 [Geodia barretti]